MKDAEEEAGAGVMHAIVSLSTQSTRAVVTVIAHERGYEHQYGGLRRRVPTSYLGKRGLVFTGSWAVQC